MCRLELNRDQIEQQFGIAFDAYFAAELEALEPLISDGLVEFSGRVIKISFEHRLLVRRVAMVFDAYLKSAPQRFSKII